MITPGPVVITVAFIGYLVAGIAGATVAPSRFFCRATCSWSSLRRTTSAWRATNRCAVSSMCVTAAAMAPSPVQSSSSTPRDHRRMVAGNLSLPRWRSWRGSDPEPIVVLAAALSACCCEPAITSGRHPHRSAKGRGEVTLIREAAANRNARNDALDRAADCTRVRREVAHVCTDGFAPSDMKLATQMRAMNTGNRTHSASVVREVNEERRKSITCASHAGPPVFFPLRAHPASSAKRRPSIATARGRRLSPPHRRSDQQETHCADRAPAGNTVPISVSIASTSRCTQRVGFTYSLL